MTAPDRPERAALVDAPPSDELCPECGRVGAVHVIAGVRVAFGRWHAWDRFTR